MKQFNNLVSICILFLLSTTSCDNRNKSIKSSAGNKYKTIDSLVSDVYSDEKMVLLRNTREELLNDSIQYPHVFDLELILEDIIDFQTNKRDYIIKTSLAFYNKNKELIVENDSIFDFDPDFWLEIDYEGNEESDQNFIGDLFYDGVFFFEKENDSFHQWTRYFETVKYHNWQMKDYPFDTQLLKFKIKSSLDTNNVRLRESKEFPASFSKNLSLPEGFEIKSIEFNEKFEEGAYLVTDDSGIGSREIISVGEFSINIKRSGRSLFFKLFLGAILSLILSISVFYIPKEEFDAKAQISVGAIFAAVGNKYFVDSNTISNVLTVADIINNSVIFLVILNVFIMIAQRSEKINWKWLEEEKNAVKFSVLIMGLTTFVILFLYL